MRGWGTARSLQRQPVRRQEGGLQAGSRAESTPHIIPLCPRSRCRSRARAGPRLRPPPQPPPLCADGDDPLIRPRWGAAADSVPQRRPKLTALHEAAGTLPKSHV